MNDPRSATETDVPAIKTTFNLWMSAALAQDAQVSPTRRHVPAEVQFVPIKAQGVQRVLVRPPQRLPRLRVSQRAFTDALDSPPGHVDHEDTQIEIRPRVSALPDTRLFVNSAGNDGIPYCTGWRATEIDREKRRDIPAYYHVRVQVDGSADMPRKQCRYQQA